MDNPSDMVARLVHHELSPAEKSKLLDESSTSPELAKMIEDYGFISSLSGNLCAEVTEISLADSIMARIAAEKPLKIPVWERIGTPQWIGGLVTVFLVGALIGGNQVDLSLVSHEVCNNAGPYEAMVITILQSWGLALSSSFSIITVFLILKRRYWVAGFFAFLALAFLAAYFQC
jgi:hypothetical protein